METYKDVIIIGAGQSGLACSYYLSRTPLTHLVLERRNASFSTWRSLWDSFHTISTKFLLDLPGLGKIEGDDDELIRCEHSMIQTYIQVIQSGDQCLLFVSIERCVSRQTFFHPF